MLADNSSDEFMPINGLNNQQPYPKKPKQPVRKIKKDKSDVSLGSMIKKITANEKEQRQKVQQRLAQNPGFSSLGVKARGSKLKLTDIEKFRDPLHKNSAVTTGGVNSSSLCHKSTKPPLIPSNGTRELHDDFEGENLDRQEIPEQEQKHQSIGKPEEPQSEAEMIESQFLTSKNSMNDTSDLEEHSGLK